MTAQLGGVRERQLVTKAKDPISHLAATSSHFDFVIALRIALVIILLILFLNVISRCLVSYPDPDSPTAADGLHHRYVESGHVPVM